MLGLMVLLPLGSSNLENSGEAGQRECLMCCWDQGADVITCVQINNYLCRWSIHTAWSWVQSLLLVGRSITEIKRQTLSPPHLTPAFLLFFLSLLSGALLQSFVLLFSYFSCAIVSTFLLALQVPVNSF